ncbi:hypothetical protein HG535_0H00460 [Zygotorulaspora mrakii]|uniref:CHY-type domain-containing protein n=1 Tax=Zygotorulaspora mrakii TaxID=42260 RepID=A0A7H9B7M0_ZYGMR|nr:uncharacterized protein HG535_0H00460 [Zygotorulaspora mrakii]QLG74721.1 hypothetical protein HG535_0H00460 [Zygotorulaspora mrakii]
MPRIKGKLVDQQSRCVHWNSPLDIVGLKFKCCESFYACYSCHKELTDHKIEKYDLLENANGKFIKCGVCNEELTFREYTRSLSCLHCKSNFNPMCKLHYHLYFDNANAVH